MIRTLFTVCALLLFSVIAAQDRLPDAIYLVVQTDAPGDEPYPYRGKTDTVRYDYRIVDSTSINFRKITVARKVAVPLVLEQAPDRAIESDLRSRLLLTLTPKASKKLRKMTHKYTGARVAVVIGGNAVTVHKIREPITGGRLQITRCTDNACEHLFYELRDNVR